MFLEFLIQHGELETFVDLPDLVRMSTLNRSFYEITHRTETLKRWLCVRMPFPLGFRPTMHHVVGFTERGCLQPYSIHFRRHYLLETPCKMVSWTWREKLFQWYHQKTLFSHYFFHVDRSFHMRCVPNLWYWEFTVKSQPFGFSYGFSTREDFIYLRSARLNVGDTLHSIGYHQAGAICRDHARLNKKRESYAKNDVMGCGYDISSSKIFFTKNGIEVFECTWSTGPVPIFPVLVMDEDVQFTWNHGWTEPFVLDL